MFVLDIGDPQFASNARSDEQLMDNPFSVEHSSTRAIVYYEPDRSLGIRVIAQQSVFVMCNRPVSDKFLKTIVVPQQSKERLREYLTQLGLSERVLFGDIPGLAAANAASIKLQPMEPLSPEQYRKRGIQAFHEGRFEDALAAYESFATVMPDVAEPNGLKGDMLSALGRFEEANAAYSDAIENLDRPIYLGGQISANREIANIMSRALHYNRGNVLAELGRHQSAVAEYDMALQNGIAPEDGVLYNRGNSKFKLQEFEEAHADFEAAWSELEESGSALAMGNCKVMMGEFDKALLEYMKGVTVVPEHLATLCRKNAEQVQQLLQTLNGNELHAKYVEHNVLYVAVEGITGHFLFIGNRGNTGNFPSGMFTAFGGKDYEGLAGFLVIICLPAS